MNDKEKDSADRLVAAYEAMFKQVHGTLASARERAVELGELTREEAEKVSRFVERDLHDAASSIGETGRDFRDRLGFDWEGVQKRTSEIFAGMADQTSQVLKDVAEQARTASEYHTGDVTGAGILRCTACGAELHIKNTDYIPPCPKCQATAFRRKPGAARH